MVQLTCSMQPLLADCLDGEFLAWAWHGLPSWRSGREVTALGHARAGLSSTKIVAKAVAAVTIHAASIGADWELWRRVRRRVRRLEPQRRSRGDFAVVHGLRRGRDSERCVVDSWRGHHRRCTLGDCRSVSSVAERFAKGSARGRPVTIVKVGNPSGLNFRPTGQE